MQVSKQLLKEAGLHPKLRLMRKETNANGFEVATSTGSHTVRLIKDKLLPPKKDPNTNKMVEYVRYLVEKDGQTYTYDTRKYHKDTGELSYLVQRMAEIPENTYVILEAKKIGTQNYISVKPVDRVDTGDTGEDIEIEGEDDDDMELDNANHVEI